MKNAAVIAFAVAAFVGRGFAQEAQAPAAKPQPTSQAARPADAAYARLSCLGGKAFIQRAADLGYEEAAANMPVAAGDRLATTTGRVEVYVGKRTYVRLDNNTKVDFAVLPKTADPLVRLRQWAGNIYLDVAKLEKEKGVEVLTSDVTFYVLDEGVYRIDAKENGQTEIFVFEGLVEASGEEGSMLVKKNQRLTIANGQFEGRPASFFASADDGFDRWNQDRVSIIHRAYAGRRLPEELEDFEGELEEYGDWRTTDEFGYVWIPNALEPGWRPYSWGRWLWMPSGWCWLPYEPWGWATFHYGYWHWGAGLGWYWIPHNIWSPAWVGWWWDPWYYGWAPLSWWGHPGVVIDNIYYGRGWNGDYPYNSRALTVVRKDQLQAPDIRKAALNPEAIKSVGKLSLAKTALTARPNSNRGVKIENLDGGRQVLLRKSGEGGPASTSGARPSPGAETGRVSRLSPSPSGTAAAGGRSIRKSNGDAGYPSSSQISRDRILRESRSLRPGTSLGRTSRYLPSRAPSPSSRARSFAGSSPRPMSRSFSSPSSRSSAPSRGGASPGRSAGSGGGSIRKK